MLFSIVAAQVSCYPWPPRNRQLPIAVYSGVNGAPGGKMKILSLLLVTLATTKVASCQSGEDTLKYYLSRSNLVVSGEMQEFICVSSDSVACTFHLRIEETFKGEVPKGNIIVVETDMFWGGDYLLPCRAERAKCIVFLN